MLTNLRNLTASLVICAFITACGGGGGGNALGDNSTPDLPEPPAPPTPPTPPTPIESFTLSGTISTSVSQSVDSDTNDPNKLAISNDEPGLAQSISSPITLGGYINIPGTRRTRTL